MGSVRSFNPGMKIHMKKVTSLGRSNFLWTIAAFLTVCGGVAMQAAAPPSTWAYWDFNDNTDPATITDSVAGTVGFLNGVVYTPSGGGVSGGAGDLAIDFGTDSLGQFVEVPLPDSSLNDSNLNDRITIAYWQKWNVPRVNAAGFRFLSDSSSGGARGISAETPWGDGQITFDTAGCCDTASQRIVRNLDTATDFPNFDVQQWHHFAFVKDGTRKTVYIDGKVFNQGVNTSPLPTDISELIIGAEDATGLNPAVSLYDNFAVFTDALPQAAIQILASTNGTLDQVAAIISDDDGDGMPNWFEDQYAFNKTDPADAAADADGDALTNLDEFHRGTDPHQADSDGDGLGDAVETGTGTWASAADTGTDPLQADTDHDGLPDGVEKNSGTFASAADPGTSPLLADTDGDGLRDNVEVDLASSPVDPNSLPHLINGQGNITWVSFHEADGIPSTAAMDAGFTNAPDATYTHLLEANGFTVTRYVTTPTPDTAVLNAADLVIISRSVNSGAYQTTDSTLGWNGITAPVMVMSGYIIRQSRLGFSTGATIPDTVGPVTLKVNDTSHPIFAGISFDAANTTLHAYADIVTYSNIVQRGISVVTDPMVAGATVLATVATESDPAVGGPVLVEYPAGTTLADEGAEMLGGKRLLFLSGSREQVITGDGAGIFDLEADGTRMFLNAVAYMLGVVAERPRLTATIQTDNTVKIEWSGGGDLEGATAVTGPWNAIAGAASPYTATVDSPARFFRVRQ